MNGDPGPYRYSPGTRRGEDHSRIIGRYGQNIRLLLGIDKPRLVTGGGLENQMRLNGGDVRLQGGHVVLVGNAREHSQSVGGVQSGLR